MKRNSVNHAPPLLTQPEAGLLVMVAAVALPVALSYIYTLGVRRATQAVERGFWTEIARHALR